jgi:DNA mismatch repair protein MutL
MGMIRALDAFTIGKIAAGEVVERPVSVVKELMENALDAKSTEITVNIEDGGHKLIRVSDNGTGMSAEDAALCLKSHTTSKLFTTEDLEKILTFGFRGEALHSIGAVSRLTVTTCDNDGVEGRRVRMEGADEQPPETAARVRGTTVEVENLFFNVPARRKFLKSPRSEIQAIDTLVARLIVAHPNVKFLLTHNGLDVFKAPGGQSIPDRIRYIFGKDIAEKIVHITGTDGRIGLDAYFTLPDMTFPNRKYHIFFVNGRLIKDRNITVAVDAAYKGLIPGGRYGLAILFLNLDSSDLDANVHPAKTEVRFAAPHEIHSLIYRALRGRFSDTGANETEMFSLTPQTSAKDTAEPTGMMNFQRFKKPAPPPVQAEPPAPPVPVQQPIFQPAETRPEITVTSASHAPVADAQQQAAGGPETSLFKGGSCHVISQFFKTYILVEIDGDPVFIDQHVASERILYNELKRKAVRRPEQLQLISEPVEVPRDVFNTLNENLGRVRAAGVEIEPFGDRAFVIRSVAHKAGPFDPASLLVAIAHEITSAPFKTPENVLTDKLLTVAACKMAVKAGQDLTLDEMRGLVEAYLKEEFNRTCPHGRPIIHKVSRENLNAWFRR